jgi:hypothetical protein
MHTLPELQSVDIIKNMEHWRNDTDKIKPTYAEKNTSQGHFVGQKSHTKYPGFESPA